MRVLSVTHGPSVPGGVFEDVVREAGHELERWVVPSGDAPRPAAAYDAVMVFGGSMHPDQDDEFHWLSHEEAFLRAALEAGVPMLGVCLGSQMLARAAGAWVAPAREPEVGWLEVELTPAGRSDPVLGVLPPTMTAFQWHSYTFGIPAGGVELARSPVCSQAFRVGDAWGIQFHAEVTLAMVRAWIEEEPHELEDPSGFLAETERRIAAWNAQGRAL
ncbi:MAG: type 1 glutamine amidotransferase, partial [Thermoleophilia bacterium]|nr:type 1 glutamine amidotransferase [Thermoleophilia bacterium]